MTKLYNLLIEQVADTPIKDLNIYHKTIFYEGEHTGLASTVNTRCCQAISEVGNLHNCSAQNLAQRLLSINTMEAAIGLAAINSTLNSPTLLNKNQSINAFDLIEKNGQGKNIAIIGKFPRVNAFRQNPFYKNLWVFELEAQADCLTPDAFEEYLPQADITLITATSLINHTFSSIIKLTKGTNILIGPSAPLSPLLFDFGIDIIAGTVVTDSSLAKRYLSQGASYRHAKGLTQVTIAKKEF